MKRSLLSRPRGVKQRFFCAFVLLFLTTNALSVAQAASRSSVSVVVLNKGKTEVIGAGFPASTNVSIYFAAGPKTAGFVTKSKRDGRFAAIILLPTNFSGLITATAKSGSTIATGKAIAKASIAVDANGIYVSPTGNDSAAGTSKAPLKTIQKAADTVKPGQTVHVLPGTYAQVHSKTSGTADKRIVYQSETRWGAKIAPNDDTTPWLNDGSYVDINGFQATDPKAASGIESTGSYVRIQYNYVHDVATAISCDNNGGDAINHSEYSSSHNEANGNVVHRIGEAGCNFIQGIYISTPQSKAMNNIVSDVGAYCLHFWHAATEEIVANNLMFNCGKNNYGGGLVLGAGDNPGGVTMDNSIVINNIVVDSVDGIMETGEQGGHNRFANNLVYKSGSGMDVSETPTGTVTKDPMFVNYKLDGSGNYRLKSGSPAIDAGFTLAANPTDITGNFRSRGRAIDIGPYEQ